MCLPCKNRYAYNVLRNVAGKAHEYLQLSEKD